MTTEKLNMHRFLGWLVLWSWSNDTNSVFIFVWLERTLVADVKVMDESSVFAVRGERGNMSTDIGGQQEVSL